MKNQCILFCLFIVSNTLLFAHEGHHAETFLAQSQEISSMSKEWWLEWISKIGHFHHFFVHFPIALLIMTVVAEILFIWYKKPLFENAAIFMLVSAAILAPVTALFGFALSLGQFYPDLFNDLFVWHRYLGAVTVILTLWVCYLRHQYAQGFSKSLCSYYIYLFFTFFVVNLTALLGGILALDW